MHLEKEGEYMESINSKVECRDDKYYIDIYFNDVNKDWETVSIPLSEDDATVIKKAFNMLLQKLTISNFTINFESSGQDLFNLVAQEYINQLNDELASVYDELQSYELG
jgi:hypothetical protein